MWGISYTNLQMLLADAQDYYPDYSKDGGSKGRDEVINADDPENRVKMHKMLGWD